jgi:MFS transporter, PAT family, beta-lactamase induction signal transducer AmpG
MGVAAYTVFLMTTVRNEYKAAHYATATALMALGLMLPGAISGYLYQALGYANFFLVSFFASLPGIFAIFFLPIWHDERPIAVGESGGDASGVSKAGQVGSESK